VGTGRMVQAIIKEHLANPGLPFDVVSNPEFLREGSAVKDCMNMERAVIGATSEKAAGIIEELHEPFHTTVIVTDLESAEMIKYAANAFLATKISFINDIANLCERYGADVTKVSEGMGLDSRIGKRFLQAGIGYGGSCFPKDTQALFHISKQVGYDFELLQAVMNTNDRQKELFMEKVVREVNDLRGKKVAVLGLTYKPNTDDMRYSPSLSVIPALVSLGADVTAYDPVGIPHAKRWIKEDVAYSDDLYQTVEYADVCVILTEWKDVANMDLVRVGKLMKTPLIIDGRNCIAPDVAKEHGFRYVSIGRPAVDGILVHK
jgi:UDPglucose 6-dehydrogenase